MSSFYSESGQDKFVAELLPKHDGVFVEFGALDGLLHSNSLYFERTMAWSGLLIEANPDAFKMLNRNRPECKVLNAAIYDHAGIVEFEKIDGGLYGWSGIKETIEPEHWGRIYYSVPEGKRETIHVPCMTLEDALLLHEVYEIDYLSIDVEGAELKILSEFPFENFDIDVIGVEDNFSNKELDELIRSKGFQFLQKVGPDRFYRHTA